MRYKQHCTSILYPAQMKRLVAGVDIDGVVTSLALVDEFGKIYAKGSFRTSDHKVFKDYVARIKDEIDALSRGLAIPHIIAAAGIGAPNGNYYTGEIENAANLAWKGRLPLAQLLGQHFSNMPVVVTNDANAAAIGEMIYGGANGMKHFVVITLGTGLGSGIVVNGNVLYGNDGYAGEVGHIIVEKEGGRICGCGRKGCLECYASSKGVKNTALELLSKSKEPSRLDKIPADELTCKEIAFAAKAGDHISKKAFETAGEYLGAALANLVAVVSPEAIFLCGGVANAGDLIMSPTKRAMEKNILPLWKGRVKLAFSSLDYENAPILGAAALAIKEIEKKSTVIARRKVF